MNNLLVLLRQILRLFFLPFYLINIFVPKYRNIWVFGAWEGKHYTGNSKALFEYVNKYHHNIQAIWLTKNKKVIKEICDRNLKAYFFYSIQGIYYSLVAKVHIMTLSWIDLPLTSFIFPLKTKYVQLWHGTPLKKLDLDLGSFYQQILRFIFTSFLGRWYDMVISASNKNISIYNKIFHIKQEKIIITGQPLNDEIFLDKKWPYRTSLKILFAPTWRSYQFNYFSYKFNLKRLKILLDKFDAVLIIKLHNAELIKLNKFMLNKKSKRLVFTKEVDVYKYFKDTDILITDYSSIYFDYLILNKPIIFTPFDIKKYSNRNGLFYKYSEVTPGPKCKDWDEVIIELNKFLKNEDRFKKKREKMNHVFNIYIDSLSSERVFKETLKISNNWNNLR